LLFNNHRLKSLDPTPQKDHDSVFKWIWANKPLDQHEYDWIFHHQDFVSLARPRRSSFETFIQEHLQARPKSLFKVCLPHLPLHTDLRNANAISFQQKLFRIGKCQQNAQDSSIAFFSTARISLVARLMAVFFAVLILFIPVILFLLVSMNKAWMAVVILGFVFSFAIIVSLLTEAGIQEIFVGTATYCAVLVTFLGIQSSARG
jgi:fatty acid desaturase